VFENKVLKRIFRQQMDEETGERRKLHNEEIHNSYVRFKVLRAASIKLRIFWDVATAVFLIECRRTFQRCMLRPSSGR
jgi:hypothetical protein